MVKLMNYISNFNVSMSNINSAQMGVHQILNLVSLTFWNYAMLSLFIVKLKKT